MRLLGGRLLHALGVALTVVNGVVAVCLVVLDAVPTLQPVARQLLVFLASAIPYTPVPVAGAALGLMLWLDGRPRLVGIALLGGALAIASLPWWPVPTGSTPRPTADALRVVSLNTEFGNADTRAVLRLAQSADILAFQENTPQFVRALEATGLLVDFPFRQGTALQESYGTMIWSRTPLTVAGFGATEYTSLVVRTTVRGTAWTVSTLHAASPKDGARTWERDAHAVAGLLRPYVGEHLVVVGDFNAVDEHVTMRRIRDVGLVDSMTGWPLAPGDGFQNSWPNDPRLPFLIRIDHALHSAGVDAWRPSYITVTGTDHRALTATFAPR